MYCNIFQFSIRCIVTLATNTIWMTYRNTVSFLFVVCDNFHPPKSLFFKCITKLQNKFNADRAGIPWTTKILNCLTFLLHFTLMRGLPSRALFLNLLSSHLHQRPSRWVSHFIYMQMIQVFTSVLKSLTKENSQLLSRKGHPMSLRRTEDSF